MRKCLNNINIYQYQAFIYNLVTGGVMADQRVWGTEVPKQGPGAEPR